MFLCWLSRPGKRHQVHSGAGHVAPPRLRNLSRSTQPSEVQNDGTFVALDHRLGADILSVQCFGANPARPRRTSANASSFARNGIEIQREASNDSMASPGIGRENKYP
jgi:hypothetical protein